MAESLTLPDSPDHCPTCNTKFTGSFCYNCGEKKTSAKDYKLSKFAAHAIDMFTHFDGKFFTSIKYLLFFPGKLTEEHLAGRRVKLMKPVQLFVVINLIYFFLLKNADVFITYLERRIKYPAILEDTKLRAAELGITVSEYVQRFDATLPATSKTFIFIIIPFIAVGVWLLNFRRIRPLVPHLIFATHFFTFFLAFILIYFELILRWFNPQELSHNEKMVGLLGGILVIIVYSFFALKRVYKQRLLITILKAIVLMAWVLAMIGLYNDVTTRLNHWWI